MMIDLYASPTPNALKVIAMIEELGLPYRVKPIDVWRGEQFEDWFVALNPNSKVPVIVDPDGPDGPHTVFESGAILMYLAEKTGRLLPAAGSARSVALQWLMLQVASLGPMAGQLNHFVLYANDSCEYARSRYVTEVRRLYDLLERRLGETRHLAGEVFTIADVAVFPWVANLASRHATRYRFLDSENPGHPNLTRWFHECRARPAIARAEAAFARIPSTLAKATPEQLDRVFGRNAYARVD
jgi:GSH-dependent disulfide-bond oxidoreductase